VLKIAVLVSGAGRTFINLLDEIDAGNLDVTVEALISTRRVTPALDAAKEKGIPTHFVSWKTLGVDAASAEVYRLCHGVDMIVTAGFLKFLKILPEWQGRVLNIHPSLLPLHGGPGFYGLRVHAAVLAAGDKISGCTVHFCDNEYDHGCIVKQLEVPVMPDDTADILAARIFTMEKMLLPQVIQSFATGELTLPFEPDQS